MALPREENAELRRQGWEVTSVTRHGISSIPRMNGPCRRPCTGLGGLRICLHRVLDMPFRGNDSRIRTDHNIHNMPIPRSLVRETAPQAQAGRLKLWGTLLRILPN